MLGALDAGIPLIAPRLTPPQLFGPHPTAAIRQRDPNAQRTRRHNCRSARLKGLSERRGQVGEAANRSSGTVRRTINDAAVTRDANKSKAAERSSR